MDEYTDPDRPLTYLYKSVNRSLVDKYLLRHWWPLAIKAIPARAPANAISIIGNLGVWIAFAILSGLALGPMTVFGPSHPWIFGLIALCFFFYQTLDALDGIQARRTGSAGPLGEFVDHWFDSFNVFLLPLGMALAFPSTPVAAIVALLLLLSATDWVCLRAVKNTDTLVFDAISSEEGQVATQLFCLAVWIFGYPLWNAPIILGYSIVSWLFMLGILGTFVTTLRALKNSQGYAALAVEMLSLLPISAWILLAFPRYGLTALLVGGLLQGFSGSRFTGELLRERLTGLKYKPLFKDILLMDAILLAGILIPGLPTWIPLALALAAILWTWIRLGFQFSAMIARVKEVLGMGLWDLGPRPGKAEPAPSWPTGEGRR